MESVLPGIPPGRHGRRGISLCIFFVPNLERDRTKFRSIHTMPTSSSILWTSLAVLAGHAALASAASIRAGEAHAAAQETLSPITGTTLAVSNLLYSFFSITVCQCYVA